MSIYHSYRGSIITDCASHLGRETIFSFLFETRLTFRQKLPQKVWMGVVFVFIYHGFICCKQKNIFTFLTLLWNGMHHYIGKVDFD